MYFQVCFVITIIFKYVAYGLDNGLGLTPPMGWLTWQRFRCNTDCVNDPENCISENLMKNMADHMAKDGYKDAGYQYIIIDDCWPAKERDSDGRLQADAKRFPSGIKALSDYVHNLGLKMGIYEDFGTHTCAGYPGSEYYMQMDAETFASWDIDYLKLDGCYSNIEQYDDGYPPVAFFLNRTKRSIYLSCEYPLYQSGSGRKPNMKRVAQACNLARVYDDITDSWESLASVMNFYEKDYWNMSTVVSPGYFNDPDMLLIGNYGLSYDQQRVQMSVWAIIAAPLIMSVDLRNIREESKALLQHKGLIAINQDKLGIQGRMIKLMGDIRIWTRPVAPAGNVAVAFVNLGTGGMPTKVSVSLASIGLDNESGYNITEVFENKTLGTFKSSSTFTCYVNPTGVYMILAKRK